MTAAGPAAPEPTWAAHRRRVPGAPPDLTLHVVDTAEISAWAHEAAGCLTAAERAHARGLQAAGSRELFLISRVALRHVLGHRLGCRPQDVPIEHDPRSGAPLPIRGRAAAVLGEGQRAASASAAPAELEGVTPLRFSVSRTAGRIAIASAARPVGVDVERLQSDVEADALIEVLHSQDRQRLRRLRGRRRSVEVTRAWSRVEAVVKSRGTGLALDPGRVPAGSRRREVSADGWQVSDVRMRSRERVRMAAAWQTDPSPKG